MPTPAAAASTDVAINRPVIHFAIAAIAAVAAQGNLPVAQGSLPAQDRGPVAHYTSAGETRAVSLDDLALEMAPRFRRTTRGQETITHLVDLHLVRTAAEANGCFPKPGEVTAQIAVYKAKLKEQGHDPDRFLAARGVTDRELTDYTTLTLALDRLVMASLSLPDARGVTNEYRELWLKDAKQTNTVVTDEAALPAGVVARVGATVLTELDLGRTLAARASAAERRRFARQVILRRLLEAEGAAKGIGVSLEQRQAMVARIRARAEADKAQGLDFDSVLQALGTNEDALVDSPVVRAQIIARSLVEARDPAKVLSERLETDAAAVLARFGARRQIEVLWLRATETPSALLPRTFERASEELAKIRAEVSPHKPFSTLARIHSEDPRTKLEGGNAGWHHQTSTRLPAAVLAWAFAAEVNSMSPPIRVDDGMCLARVRAVEPDPDRATLQARLTDALEEELYQELLERAAVRYAEDS